MRVEDVGVSDLAVQLVLLTLALNVAPLLGRRVGAAEVGVRSAGSGAGVCVQKPGPGGREQGRRKHLRIVSEAPERR